MQTILKRFSPALFFLLAFAFPETTTNSLGQSSPVIPSDSSFQPGEELTYKIYYNWNFIWLSAGEVTFKVIDDDTQYHFQATGKTYSSYEWFFKVNDRYDSWVDKNTLLPNYSERNINEGNYTIFEKIKFNQANNKTTVWRARKRGMEETKSEHDVESTVHDILSSLYYLRNLDLASKGTGATQSFRIFMDKEEYPLKMRFVGKETNKKVHGAGRFRTQKYQPDVIAGNVFSDDAKMSVWVSDDANRIPVLIESPVSVGSVKVVLKSHKGLKYDFEAKVE